MEGLCGKKDSGAFTVSQSDVKNMIRYIKNQEAHHAKKTFREEYIEFLNEYEIDFKLEYIFTDD